MVTCPETRENEAVEIDAKNAVRRALRGRTELQLADCTRWPERGACDQPCLEQIENSTDGPTASPITAKSSSGFAKRVPSSMSRIAWVDEGDLE